MRQIADVSRLRYSVRTDAITFVCPLNTKHSIPKPNTNDETKILDSVYADSVVKLAHWRIYCGHDRTCDRVAAGGGLEIA